MLFGLSEQLSPVRATDTLSETVPEKLAVGATVMVEVTAAFAKPVTLVGLAETVKSVTRQAEMFDGPKMTLSDAEDLCAFARFCDPASACISITKGPSAAD